MDSYEQEIARQSGGPFSNRQERKTIRRATEHWVECQRYSAERTRRFATYAKWIGIVGPLVLLGLKFLESYLAKGS